MLGMGLPITMRNQGVGSISYSSEAQALFAAMAVQQSASWKSAANTLINGLVSNGIWPLLDFLHLPVASTLQASCLNWKLPGTYDLVPVYTPLFVPFRGISSNGSNSYYRTQFTPSTAVGANWTLNSASLWTWISSATPNQSSVREIGTLTAPMANFLARGTSNQFNGIMNDGSATDSTATVTNAAGFVGLQRVSSTLKRFTRNGVAVGPDQTRVSTSLANQEIWVCGANATNFSQRQIQACAGGASLSGKELAFYNLMAAFMAAVVPAATRGVYWAAGDSYVSGSGGTDNVGMGPNLNQATGQTYTSVAAGGSTLAQQATAILAQSSLWGTSLFWWEGIGNGSGGSTADLATVQSVIDAPMSPSKILILSNIIIGPPVPGVTDVALADRIVYRNGLLLKGCVCPDVQGFMNSISPAGASKTAGLVDPSLLQADVTHMLQTTADQVTTWVLPTLNSMP